ncbi:hypothetical protein [Streptomyces phaeochromogenes]
MSCENEKAAFGVATDGFVSDWESFNDANTALDNAAGDFWQATAQTWGAMALGALVDGGTGALAVGWLTYSAMEAAEDRFSDAREVYDREWRDAVTGYDKLQRAAKVYCRCVEQD